MNLEDLQVEIENDLRMGNDMALESLRLPTLLNKYCIFRTKEKILLDALKLKRDEIYYDVFSWYADLREPREGEKRCKLNCKKTEAYELAKYHNNVKVYDEKISVKRTKVEYLDQMISHIAFRNNSIKNIIDWKKFQAGV